MKNIIAGSTVFDPKTRHCYNIVSKRKGTRNRVTAKDIYGKTARFSMNRVFGMTPFEYSIVSEGERVARRKDKLTNRDKQLSAYYRSFAGIFDEE